MFPVAYVPVVVAINGELPLRFTFRASEAQEAAAERYYHYQYSLGAFVGSCFENGITCDRFERGTITIG
jgi:hypothetical protein